MRVGILGGSFDPIHVGHLILAETCRAAAGLDRIRFMVAGQPPHKRRLSSADDRLEMARRATEGNPAFDVDDREVRRSGPSFSIDTVRELEAELPPGTGLAWVIGADTLPDLPDWRNGLELVDRIEFVTARRPGHDAPADLEALAARIGPARAARLAAGLVETPLVGVSSTEIRRRVAEGLPIRYLVPETVRQWIESRGLYRRPEIRS